MQLSGNVSENNENKLEDPGFLPGQLKKLDKLIKNFRSTARGWASACWAVNVS
jgi:hypothetical protein